MQCNAVRVCIWLGKGLTFPWLLVRKNQTSYNVQNTHLIGELMASLYYLPDILWAMGTMVDMYLLANANKRYL